ncbi:MAG TPA: PAS domain S-box protein [Spirochaetota bacterium]|nr:PAS domain S-box protein [Spirochaetota bacterium]
METVKVDIRTRATGDTSLLLSLIETGNANPERNSFLSATLEVLVNAFNARAGSLYLFNSAMSEARLIFGANMRNDIRSRLLSFPIDGSPLFKIAINGDIAVFNMEEFFDLNGLIDEDVLPRIAALPLRSRGRTAGVINICFDRSCDIDDETRNRLIDVVRAVGLILDGLRDETDKGVCHDKVNALALEATGDGVWEWDMESDLVTCNKRCLDMFGLPHDAPPASRGQWASYIHPDDRDTIIRLIDDYCNGRRSSYEADIRIGGQKGFWRWISHKGKIAERNSEGKPVRMVGAVTDITRRKTLEEILLDLGERYKTVVSNANEGILVVQNGKLVFCNQKMVEMTGYSLDELYAYPLSMFIHPDDFDSVNKLFTDRVRNRNASNHETFRIIDRSGRELWVEDSSSQINWNNSPALLDFITDITDRLKAEKSVRESEQRYRHLFLHSPVGIFHFNEQFRITECNERFSAIMDIPRERIVGLALKELTDPRIMEFVEKAEKNQTSRIEGEYSRVLSGKTINMSYSGTLLRGDDGTLTGGIGIVEDISSRVKSEKIIRQYVRHLVSVDKIGQLISSHADSDTLISTLVREVRRVFSCERAWIIQPCDPRSQTWKYLRVNTAPNRPQMENAESERMTAPEMSTLFAKALESRNPIVDNDFPSPSAIEHDATSQMVISLKSAAGGSWLLGVSQTDPARKWTDDEIKLLRDIAQRLTDALDSHRMRTELLQIDQILASIMKASHNGIVLVNAAGIVTAINTHASEYTGIPVQSAIGVKAESLIVLHDINTGAPLDSPVTPVLAGNCGNKIDDAIIISAEDGKARNVRVLAIPVTGEENNERAGCGGCILILSDLTEKIRIERELGRGQKFESMGLIAGGIAHDFNNILTGIIGSISLAKMRADDKDKTAKLMNDAEKAAFRAQKLTQQLLSFSKGGTPSREIINIRETVEESSSFALRGSNIVCRYDFVDNLPPVSADRGQISQVIQNIIINALQAMRNGGTITIKIDTIISVGADVPAGNFVRISFSDTGAGIPKENIPRIFDPYFSTKETGSGLGLAVVSSIIAKHGGDISVRSVQGEGTTFTILLPAAKTFSCEESASSMEIVRGTGKILLMDDDESVQHVVASMLGCLGYKVHCAFNGEEAVRMYRAALSKNIPFDLVIMDLTIPGGMGGKDAVAELRRLKPDLLAIVASGYSDDPVMANHREYGFDDVIVKPFRIEELSRTISILLSPPK